MNLNKESFDEFIERLKYHNKGDGVDDHLTANPLFVVQAKRLVSGIDLNYDPPYYWTDSDHEDRLSDEELKAKLCEDEADGWEYDPFDICIDDEVTYKGKTIYQKIGYSEHWEYVNAHLTKEGAEVFIRRKKHDYGELRIFVDSQYWCWEFNAIIDGLLNGQIVLKDK